MKIYMFILSPQRLLTSPIAIIMRRIKLCVIIGQLHTGDEQMILLFRPAGDTSCSITQSVDMIQFGKAHYFNVGFFSCFTNKVLCHEFLPGNEPCFLNYYFLNQPYFFCSIFPPICMLTFKHVTESINFEHVCCFQGKCRFFFA